MQYGSDRHLVLFRNATEGDKNALLMLYQDVAPMWSDGFGFIDPTGMMTREDWSNEGDLKWLLTWHKWEATKSSFVTYSYTVVYRKLQKVLRGLCVNKRTSIRANPEYADNVFYGASNNDDVMGYVDVHTLLHDVNSSISKDLWRHIENLRTYLSNDVLLQELLGWIFMGRSNQELSELLDVDVPVIQHSRKLLHDRTKEYLATVA